MRLPLLTLTTVLGVGAAAISGYWFGQSRTLHPAAVAGTKASSSRESAAPAGNAQMVHTIAELERRLASLESKQATVDAVSSANLNESPAPGVIEAPDLHAVMERQHDADAEFALAVATRLNTESRDRPWATATEDNAKNAVNDAVLDGAQFSAKTVKCFTSICEVVLSAATPEQLRNVMLQLPQRISGMAGFNLGQAGTAPDGSTNAAFHLFRAGYPVPGRE